MSTLKLQLLLGAVEKITAPLKAISGQSKVTANDLKNTKQRIKELETQTAQVDGYRTLGKQIGITRSQLSQAQNAAQQLGKKLSEAQNPTKAMVREFERAKLVVRDLTAKEREMVAKHGQVKRAMNEAGISTKQLSSYQRTLKADLASATAQYEKQRASITKLADTQKRLDSAKAAYNQTKDLQGKLAGNGAGMLATGTAMGLPVLGVVKEYSSFEDAMKGVAKQVDGARNDAGKLTAVYYDMALEIKNISEQIPQINGAIDIAKLVEGGARMGVKGKDDLLVFAKTAAKAATAFELPADQLAEDMGKIANLYKIPIKNIESLGDAINYLDDNAQSKGADIINVMQRLGGVADKLNFKQAAALGSTFLSLGSAPEIAASASNAMVRELSIATMQSGRFKSGLAAIGMKDTDIEKRMSTDSMGTIIAVLKKIKQLKPEEQLRVTTQLFGKEFGDDAAKLSNNLDELERQLKLVESKGAKGSMQRESDSDKDSLSSQWLLFMAGMKNIKASLGETLRGPIMEIINMTKGLAKSIRSWVEANPELAGTLLKVAAVSAAVVGVMGALSLSLAAILGPMAIMKLAMSVLGIKASLLGLAFGKLAGAIKFMGSALVWVARALMTNPIIAAAALLAGAVYLIYKNWDTLVPWFKSVWEQCKGPALAFWNVLKEVFSWTPIGLLTSHWGTIWNFFDTLPEGAMNKGRAIVSGLIDGITAKWRDLMDAVKNLTKYLPDWVTGGGVTVSQENISGPNYLTGNGGGGLAMAGGGYMPKMYTPKPLAQKAVNNSVSVSAPIYIQQQPGQSATSVAQEVSRQLDDRERRARAASRASLGDTH